jgi:hypothetical protein
MGGFRECNLIMPQPQPAQSAALRPRIGIRRVFHPNDITFTQEVPQLGRRPTQQWSKPSNEMALPQGGHTRKTLTAAASQRSDLQRFGLVRGMMPEQQMDNSAALTFRL